jgi:hypothetical protein
MVNHFPADLGIPKMSAAATVVAPGHAKIVPLMPEFIAPQDGAEKQDCERNAVKRWFARHHFDPNRIRKLRTSRIIVLTRLALPGPI